MTSPKDEARVNQRAQLEKIRNQINRQGEHAPLTIEDAEVKVARWTEALLEAQQRLRWAIEDRDRLKRLKGWHG